MIEFFARNLGTIITALTVVGIVTAIAVYLRRNAKKGRCPGCGSSCESCRTG